MSDPATDIVWIARAGYGCAHVLPALPAKVPCEKSVIGFSDATALSYAFLQVPGICVIHGPMLNGLAAKVDDLVFSMHSQEARSAAATRTSP
ncbi:LD-carboxypeptidase [Paraburkholderia strydomiana]|uniref:LD-carboxypeptidase n=1 Tax=Paraburkholderia strydomiana TaxID=1245417 RepID=UPI0028655101|nr:LD-carboxypeptidase [Paraburkholderia strydomiana]MDR7006228.1 muramoyltetrapeptide carboxypeptidase LdcA involved in peptidoglycan recycling [Paraburkholderia strydomiana]